MKPNNRQLAIALVAFVVAALAFIFLNALVDRSRTPGSEPGEPSPADVSIHLTMGNPSGATTDPDNRDNYLMRKPYFALAYNNAKGTPNWVSWCLQDGDFGSAPRSQFYPDLELPRSFKHVTPHDYTSSGFDRGHMCPRSDRTSTAEAAHATFVMTNIVPQAPAVNQKAWADFEDYCRDLVRKKHRTLYIVAGPQGQGGTGTDGAVDTIARGKVTVPAKCWKVVLVVDEGRGDSGDVDRVSTSTRVIAVVMPNEESVGHGWAKFRTSLEEVETLTGYRFFERVPADVRDTLKVKVDQEHIPAGRPRRTGD